MVRLGSNVGNKPEFTNNGSVPKNCTVMHESKSPSFKKMLNLSNNIYKKYTFKYISNERIIECQSFWMYIP